MNNSIAEPRDPLPAVALDQLPPRMREAAARADWKTLMPVQATALPYLLAARNMLIQARTGSGKTGAFILPMLERLKPNRPHCQALILVPTRELAKQVWQEAETLCGSSGLRTVAVYGGVGYGASRRSAGRAVAHKRWRLGAWARRDHHRSRYRFPGGAAGRRSGNGTGSGIENRRDDVRHVKPR